MIYWGDMIAILGSITALIFIGSAIRGIMTAERGSLLYSADAMSFGLISRIAGRRNSGNPRHRE